MKLLVVSNNCLSLDNNNGKVMRNYLHSFSDDELCNFYISDEKPPEKISSINITNKDALKKLLTFGLAKIDNKFYNLNSGYNSNIRYSPFKHFLRYLVWNSSFWKTRKYRNFIRDEKPEKIVTFLGNNPYLLKLSIRLAKKLHIPLVLFIGEDYPLKNFDYISRTTKMGFWFKTFHKIEKRVFSKATKCADLVIFNSEYIRDAYADKYQFKKYDIIYHLSSQISLPSNDKSKIILYAGNTGLGRIDSLIEFSKVLYELDSTFKLKIFGNADDENIKKLLSLQNVDYHSFVSNNELLKEYEKAFGLIHIEKFDDYNNIDLRFAFSTKIADMICMNKPFLIYAPDCLACCKHLLKYDDSLVAATNEQLKQKLSIMLKNEYNKAKRAKLIDIHRIENSVYIKEIICSLK